MPSAPDTDTRFADAAVAEVEKIAKLIDAGETAGFITPMSASVHRLWLALLRDPGTRTGDRIKAIEHIGKLQSLYAATIAEELSLPTNMSMARLVEAIAARMNIQLISARDALNGAPRFIEPGAIEIQ